MQVVAAVQEYISYAAQVVEHAGIFFEDNVEFENDEAMQVLKDEDIPKVMDCFRVKMQELENVDVESVKALLKAITKELKLGGKKVYMPLRVALTGKMHGPDLFHIIPIIGRERTLTRLDTTLAKI